MSVPVPCPKCGRLYTWDGKRCCRKDCRHGSDEPPAKAEERRSITVKIDPQKFQRADEARGKAERGFFTALAQARTGADLEEAVGPLGVVLRLHDHGWAPICYADTHRYPGFSLAIALDSQRRWYTSSLHYCGTFSQYREWKSGERDELPAQWEYFERLRAIEASPNLEAARPVLLSMGFTERADPS